MIDAVEYANNEYADNPLMFKRECPTWVQEAVDRGVIVPEFRTEDYWYLRIRTLQGEASAGPGDFVCRQIVNGVEDIWPCDGTVFAATYDPA